MTQVFAMHMPEDMELHLELASAAQGLSKSEYARTALAVALNAEPVVTPELVSKARAARRDAVNRDARKHARHDRQRDLADA
jgi:hypothetical protein